MADYVNSNILCQAYFHVKIREDNPEKLDEVRKELSDFVSRRGKFFLYEDVEVDVRFEDGSIIGYCTLGGSLLALYKFIKDYPSFREGVIVLYGDVKRLAETFINEGLFLSRTRSSSVIHTEARTGVIGSIKHMLDIYQYIQEHNGFKDSDDVIEKVLSLYPRTVKLLGNVKTDSDRKIVSSIFLNKIESMPSRILLSQKERDKLKGTEIYASDVAQSNYNNTLLMLKKTLNSYISNNGSSNNT